MRSGDQLECGLKCRMGTALGNRTSNRSETMQKGSAAQKVSGVYTVLVKLGLIKRFLTGLITSNE